MNMKVVYLLKLWVLRNKTRPQNPEKKHEKKDIFENLCTLFEGRERVLDSFERKRYTNKIENRITFKIKQNIILNF